MSKPTYDTIKEEYLNKINSNFSIIEDYLKENDAVAENDDEPSEDFESESSEVDIAEVEEEPVEEIEKPEETTKVQRENSNEVYR